MSTKKRIAIIGSTGSIGTQALEVIKEHSDLFEVEAITAQNNVELLIEQALLWKPKAVVIGNASLQNKLSAALAGQNTEVLSGEEGLLQVAKMPSVDLLLTALVGYAGLLPTIAAIESKKNIALANKETLVVAGELITELAKKHGVSILPVDSEHSAIFQCLVGEPMHRIEKLILTASGGPFRGKKREDLAKVSKAQALKHPNWSMGAKITIDSASLMNKGLEVIEAKWLFGVEADQIDVLVHPQSIIHSLVQFNDGSLKAQLGLPDMKLPIQYAFSYPDRISASMPRTDLAAIASLSFEKPDSDTFRNLQLAFDALKRGGNAPCLLNAANEVAVESFLKDQIGFLQIAELNEQVLNACAFSSVCSLETYQESDRLARAYAYNWVKSKS